MTIHEILALLRHDSTSRAALDAIEDLADGDLEYLEEADADNSVWTLYKVHEEKEITLGGVPATRYVTYSFSTIADIAGDDTVTIRQCIAVNQEERVVIERERELFATSYRADTPAA